MQKVGISPAIGLGEDMRGVIALEEIALSEVDQCGNHGQGLRKPGS